MDNYDYSWLPKGATIEVTKLDDYHDQREGTIPGGIIAKIIGVSGYYSVRLTDARHAPITREFDLDDDCVIRAFDQLKEAYLEDIRVSKYLRSFP